MGINQRKAGAVLSYVVLGLNSIVGILYTPIMLRLMGQSEYGLYSLVASVIAYLTMFDLGFGNAIVRYTAKYRAVGDKLSEAKLNGMFIVIYSIIATLVLAIGLIFSNNVEFFFSQSLTDKELEKAKILFIILTLNLALSFPLGIFSSILTAYEKFIFPNIITIARTILMPGIMLPLLFAGYRSVAMVTVISLLNLVALLINMGYALIKLKVKFEIRKFDFSILKEIMPYSFYIFLNIVVDKLYASTDNFILGIVSGTAAVAIYAIAMQLYSYYAMFSTSINSVFLPKLTMIATTDDNSKKELSDVFVRIGRIQFLILSLILSGFIVFGQSFIELWAGDGYRSAYYICLIIMIPAIIPLSQNIGITILQAKNMHKFRAIIYIFIAIGNVIISIPLAKLYGGIGAAVGTAIANLIGQILTMNWYYHKKVQIDIPEYWKQILKLTSLIAVPLLLGVVLNTIISAEGWIPLMSGIVIYTVFFSLFVWKFAINEYERQLLSAVIGKVVRITKR